MVTEIPAQVNAILETYDPAAPGVTADALRAVWLEYEPKGIAAIKAEQREQQETLGIPIPVLKSIGRSVGKVARQRVDDFVPLANTLWDEYGREGRTVALVFLGPMELAHPETIVPLLKTLCRTCITWEDADRLAMDALEPIVREDPARWLGAVEPWLADESKWVRRAGVTVVGRLPMKHPTYTALCLDLTERLLHDTETDVRRAVSFAVRLCARGDVALVRAFLADHVPTQDPAATWVLCDAIRSMAKKLLPELASLLPNYEQWAADPTLSARDRRSVESAIKTLQRAQE